jgi:nucleoside-diphosphate-sugar epimerase
MKILVFGGNGFIGKHLVDRLSGEAEVTRFDRRSYRPTDYLGDIKDSEAVTEAIVNCDRWINLAGLLGTSELIDRVQNAVDVNITGAVNIYQAAMKQGCPGVQITVGNHWMNNPYSITKSTAERLAIMYARERDTDIRIVRAMNVYGPGQKAHPVRKLMPNVIIPALEDRKITVYGSGNQVMDMIYVRDAVEILARVLLMERPPEPGEIIEAGAGPVTVNEVVQMVCEIAGGGRVEHAPMRAGEEEQAVVQISEEGIHRLERLIGFNVHLDCTPIRKALHATIEWYRSNN